MLDADTWPGMPTGNFIRSGIELNKYGRRVAYWMYRQHPGDRVMGRTPSPQELLRIPAEQVAHMFEPERPGQLRGVSTSLRSRAPARHRTTTTTRCCCARRSRTCSRSSSRAALGIDDLTADPMTGQTL
jgi:hypothetical protein